MVNCMAKFLPKLYLKPLTNLTKKEVPWNWSTAENDAFENIKSQVTTSPVLEFYNPSKELTLEIMQVIMVLDQLYDKKVNL